MSTFNQHICKIIILSGVTLLLSSCANTKISQSWVEPNHNKSYNDLLIIGIGESEQNRRAYESYFTAELKEHKIESVASYTLIKSNEKMDRDTVVKAIDGLGIDAVIVTHMIAVDEETVYRTGHSHTGYNRYSRNMYSYYPRVNSYVHRPGYYTTHETYTFETSLYDIVTEELVWTARSRTFSPGAVDEVIVDLTKLLIKDLKEKNLIKKK